MVKCVVIHNKHEGCYDFQYYEDEVSKLRFTSITINPPKIFMFDSREQAQDFFEEYINDCDVLDLRCKKGEDVVHIDYCTCGIIELDDDENPILFYNKKNQIFLMETGPQVFLPPQELKNDVKNLNLTNKLIRKCKTLGKEQRKRYIELGKYCEECGSDEENEVISGPKNEQKNEVLSEAKIETKVEPKNQVVSEVKGEVKVETNTEESSETKVKRKPRTKTKIEVDKIDKSKSTNVRN